MPAPRRGEIYLIRVPRGHTVGREEFGDHWHVVVSRDEINEGGRVVMVVPLTWPVNKETGQPKARGITTRFWVSIPDSEKTWDAGQENQCKGESLALTEQTRAVDQKRLVQPRVGFISAVAMGAIEAALAFVLKMPLPGRTRPM